MPIKAVFLDRDGTLNLDPGYLGDPESVELYPGVIEGLSLLKNRHNFLLVVISNQSGITRGLISKEQVERVNERINELLTPANSIDAFYYCPFHPDFDDEKSCKCRKPSPYLVVKASEEWNIDLTKSYFIGDKGSDIECGNNAGIKTILIKNTLSESEINSLHNEGKTPNFVADDFLEACDFIIKDFIGG